MGVKVTHNMKRAIYKESNLNKSSPKDNLNKSSTGCAPCLKEVSKIDKKISNRSLSEIKINEIKEIVNSIFEKRNDKHQKS